MYLTKAFRQFSWHTTCAFHVLDTTCFLLVESIFLRYGTMSFHWHWPVSRQVFFHPRMLLQSDRHWFPIPSLSSWPAECTNTRLINSATLPGSFLFLYLLLLRPGVQRTAREKVKFYVRDARVFHPSHYCQSATMTPFSMQLESLLSKLLPYLQQLRLLSNGFCVVFLLVQLICKKITIDRQKKKHFFFLFPAFN